MYRNIIFIILLFYIPNYIAITIERRFPTNRNGDKFTNMIVKDSLIYLAENGWIHILDSNLSPEQSFRTCVSDDCENVNKVLALYNDMTVICGTGNSGIGQVWKNGVLYTSGSSDMSVENHLVVSEDISRPSVGLVYNGDLYLGVTYGDGLGTTSNGFEAYKYLLSRTDLRTNFSLLSYVTLQNQINDDYLVFFRKVFNAGSFIYFLTNQKLNLESSRYGADDYKTKLIRICINETYGAKKIQSYTDIVLSYEVEGVGYNLLQDAEFLPSTGKLVAVSSNGDDPENPTAESAICVYTIDAVDDAILRAKEDFVTCFTTDSTNNASVYLDTELSSCVSRMSYHSSAYICPSAGRTKVIGSITLQSNSSHKLADNSSRITKVRGTDRYGLYSDVYLGTDKGTISKVSIDDGLSIEVYEGNLAADRGHTVRDIHIANNHVYVLSKRKIFLGFINKSLQHHCSLLSDVTSAGSGDRTRVSHYKLIFLTPKLRKIS